MRVVAVGFFATLLLTVLAVMVLGIVLTFVAGMETTITWIPAHLLHTFFACALVVFVGMPIVGQPYAARQARARIAAAGVDIQASLERLAKGQYDNAEALANKVLLAGRTEGERTAALFVLAEVADARGDFAREDELLREAWENWPKLAPDAAGVQKTTFAKRAFARAAQGRLDDAEALLPPRGEGTPPVLELRARAVLVARRGDWAGVTALLAGVDVDALADLGPRSKLLLKVLRARAEGKTGAGGAYRAGATPDETADPEARAWVTKVIGA
jgi:uncharacterized protein HemY